MQTGRSGQGTPGRGQRGSNEGSRTARGGGGGGNDGSESGRAFTFTERQMKIFKAPSGTDVLGGAGSPMHSERASSRLQASRGAANTLYC